MIRRYGKLLRFALMLVDGSLAVVLSMWIYWWFAHPDVTTEAFIDVFGARAVVYGVAWVVLLYVNGAYRLRAHWTIAGEAATVVRAAFWLAGLGVAALLLSATDIEGSGWALLLFPLQGILAVIVRAAMRVSFQHARRSGHNVRNIVVLGTGPEAVAFSRLVNDHSVLGVQVVAYLGPEPTTALDAPHWGRCEELPRVLRDQVVDEVAICVGQADWPHVEELAQLAHEEGKLVRVPLTVPQLQSSQRFLEDLDGTAVLSYDNGPDELTRHAIKRTLDFGIAALGLVIVAPFLLLIALAMRISQGPGILFRQQRVGMHGRVFTMYKLRTMIHDAEERFPELAEQSHQQGAAFKLRDDPRVTPIGRHLRRYNLDELPQLWNVLRGEMSVVGPRPAPPREVERYDLWHRRRLSVRPGMTGLWQITRDYEHFDRRATLDMQYIEKWSIWLDLYILFKTIPAVLRRPAL